MTLSPIYVLFIVGAVGLEVVILFIHRAILNKTLPGAVTAYDKSFVATRESIAGARDIRILGKQAERSAEAVRQNKELAKEERLAIVLGTEGDGLKKTTIASCDYTVKIPMSHGVDSLNVAAAGAVAFWQLCKNN